MGQKRERKYLAHYIDVSFCNSISPDIIPQAMNYTTPLWLRLGKDLEEYEEELNPVIEVHTNMRGEVKLFHSGYQAQSEVETFYAYDGDALDKLLFYRLADISYRRLVGEALETYKVDVLFHTNGVIEWAYKEKIYIVPGSVGGDTSGIQIPFTIYNLGNPIDVSKSTFLDFATGTLTVLEPETGEEIQGGGNNEQQA